MDADGTVWDQGVVYVENDRIAGAGPSGGPSPQGFEDAIHIDTAGTIYPGLVELHNHLSYDILPIWDVPQKFNDRSEWRDLPDRKMRISAPMSAIAGAHPEYVPTIVRYVECKCLAGGVTTSQGMSLFAAPGIAGKYRGLVRNVEGDAGDPALRPALAIVDMGSPDKIADAIQNSSCVLLHLSEGLDQNARDEFLSLKLPNDQWAISKALAAIHCTGLLPDDFQTLGQLGGATVWSPMSNLMLYGGTAQVAAAKANGIRLALGADWSPTGSKNLLGELKVAWLYSEQQGHLFSPRELVAMVTTNAAEIVGWRDQLGSIAQGMLADLMVVQGADGDPYLHLIRANESQISLVVIGGVPRYGSTDLLRTVGHTVNDSFEADVEPWPMAGQTQGFYLKQSDAHPAVAQYTLKEAAERLHTALTSLPNPPGFAPHILGMMDMSVPDLTLELDNNEPDEVAGALDAEAVVPVATDLDELTVAEAPERYFGRIEGQHNLPDYVKAGLRELYSLTGGIA
jgi:cytosine/adenosine deaminase-related metal-dependent hydrolase